MFIYLFFIEIHGLIVNSFVGCCSIALFALPILHVIGVFAILFGIEKGRAT